MALVFPVPLTALVLVVVALASWLAGWVVGNIVSAIKRDWSWGRSVLGLVQRMAAYGTLFLGAGLLTGLLAALCAEVVKLDPDTLRRVIWSPVCTVSSIVSFAEIISILRNASRLMPDGETGRQVRRWLKPFVLLVQEVGDRTVETSAENLRKGAALFAGNKKEHGA